MLSATSPRTRLDATALLLSLALLFPRVALAQDAGTPPVEKQGGGSTATTPPPERPVERANDRAAERRALAPFALQPPPPWPSVEGPLRERCEGWENTYVRVRTATVKVETPEGTSAGFLFGDGRHIVTTFHAVDTNRDLVITFSNGEKSGARVVDVDEENDVAILEAPNARAPSAALQPRVAPIAPGLAIGAIGHPLAPFEELDGMKGLLVWSLSTGTVSNVSDKLVQFDAASSAGNTGGPLVDCHGFIVGMVAPMSLPGEGLHFAVPVRQLARLYERVASGNAQGFNGKWRFEHLSLNFLAGFHRDERPVGIGLGLDFSYSDRFVAHGEIGSLWDDHDALFHRWDRTRIQGALTAGYRVVISSKPKFPIKLTLAGGAFGQYVERNDEWGLAVASNCGAPECPVSFSTRNDRASEFRVLPTLAAELLVVNHVRVAYSYAASLKDLELGHHTIAAGVVFF